MAIKYPNNPNIYKYNSNFVDATHLKKQKPEKHIGLFLHWYFTYMNA